MIPFAGFRSGLFSLPLSLLLFIILVFQNTEKKRIQLVVTISLVMILILVFYFFVLDESPLISRFKLHFSQLLSGNIDEFLQGRLTLWKAAVTMIRNYPLAGVGVGAYIIELPNLGISQLSDSALNYFIQIGAELGAIGLLIFIWMYYSIFRKIIRGKKEIKGEKKEYRFIYIGLTCSLFSIFLNYLFHTFIGSFEMKYFFWLFLGVLFIYTKTEPVETKKKKKTKNIGLFVLTGFTLLLSWTSIHSLSLTKQEIKLDWNQNFGFYPEETGEEELPFRWSKKRAGFSIQFNSDRITIPIKASHPNIESAPVYVEFYSADRFFNKIKLIHTVQLRTTNWQKVFIQFERKMGKIDKILLEVSRTWQPMKELDSSDQRKLGIAVGKIEFDLHFPRA